MIHDVFWTACIICGAAVFLKMFFTLWRVAERRFWPDLVRNADEMAFKGLRNCLVTVHLKDGSVLPEVRYIRTMCFDSGEFGLNGPVYFEFQSQDQETVLVSGSEIGRISTRKGGL